MRKANAFLLLSWTCCPTIWAFLHHPFHHVTPPSQRKTSVFALPPSTTTTAATAEHDLLNEIKKMSAATLQRELKSMGISTADIFEKDELVKRYYDAKKKQTNKAPRTPSSDRNIVRVPLYFTQLDTSKRVAAVNLQNEGGIMIEPSAQPYATIQIQLDDDTGSSSSSRTLSLLLDTACSGFVLRPETVRRYNLPSYQTPVTMTGAGGTTGMATGLTQLRKFRLGGQSFGPLPAAVQDIGALPASLDGIVGLSFIGQFATVELDFRNGVASFYRNAADTAASHRNDDLTMIADSEMRLLPRLGLYVVPVYLDNRGPVNMLVDSGAACTLLSWKGAGDLGLNMNSEQIVRQNTPMGAMGSDNVAIHLTHQFRARERLHLGQSKQQAMQYQGLALDNQHKMQNGLPIDIGRIPILESLAQEGVGGILGIDALMRCSLVRICNKGNLRLTLFR